MVTDIIADNNPDDGATTKNAQRHRQLSCHGIYCSEAKSEIR
jgi:hypothetical protein